LIPAADVVHFAGEDVPAEDLRAPEPPALNWRA
jgi:hypothetical protein